MIPLAPALIEHARSNYRRPAVRAFFAHQRGPLALLRWQRLYSGNEPDFPSAIAIAPDGSLLRAAFASASSLRVQRIPNPGPAANFANWSALPDSAQASGGVALAVGPSEILLAYTNASRQLLVRSSTNNGATWSSPVTVTTEATDIANIAAAFNPATGNPAIFYSRGTTNTLRVVRRSGATWGSPATWTRSNLVSAIFGIGAAHHAGDFHLLITGRAAGSNSPRAWGAVHGDGFLPTSFWSDLFPIAEADPASTVTYAGGSLVPLQGHLRAAFVQRETAAVPVDRVMESATPDTTGAASAWTEPTPHEATSAWGLALAAAPSALWAATPSGVWRATIEPTVDLSQHVVALSYRIGAASARARLELDDTAARLFGAVYPGGTLDLWPGYLVNGSPAFGLSPSFTVTRVTRRVTNGRRVLTIEGAGALDLLADWRAPQSWQTAPGVLSRFQLATHIAGRAGFTFATEPSADSARWNEQPGFVLPLGESAASALARLAATTPDVYVAAESLGLTLRGAPPAPPAYAFGPGHHPITSLELVDEPPAANWVRVQGADRYADAADFSSVYQHGPQLRPLRALEVASNAAATAAAAAALRRHQWSQVRAELVAPFFPGVQLFDVVDVEGQPYRVLAHACEYRRGPAGARYDSILTLGAL